MLKKIEAWLLAHPAIVHLMDGLFVAVGVAEVTYLKPIIAGGTMPTMNVLLAGLGGVAVYAAKMYVQMVISKNQGIISAWAQDLLESLDAAPAASTVPPAAVSVALKVSKPTTAAMTPVKMILFLVGLGLLTTSANAGYVIASHKAENTGLSLSLPPGTGLYLMSIEGFDVGASLPKPTYGLSFNEDFVLGDTITVNGTSTLAPILGAGGSLYLDGAGVLNGDGPLVLMGGFNVLGPDLDLFGMGNGQGLVPNVLFVYDFANKSSKVTGGLTVFADLFPGSVTKVSGN